ncbi:MAG TPA: hypothetical protein VGI63_10490, partial [Verrucomicrobiae bacterium]
NPFEKNQDEPSPFSRLTFVQPEEKSQPGSDHFWSLRLNANDDDGFSGDERKPESAWTSVFAQPAQPKQTSAQLEEMERFRALMEPGSLPDKTPIPARFSVTPAPAPVDPFLQPQSQFNPAGRSAAAVENNIGRPTGIQPLPGLTGPAATPPKSRPSWQAQLPPWLQSGPQPHDLNRNF